MNLNDLEIQSTGENAQLLSESKTKFYLQEISPEWTINDKKLQRRFIFKDFRSALEFCLQIGELAETVNHHPDILLKWGSLTVTQWTHEVSGLTLNDFILAAKFDDVYHHSELV